MALFATTNVAAAAPRSIVILRSAHDLDYAYNACEALLKFTDIDAVTRVVKGAPDSNPGAKSNKQLLDGISECKSVSDPRELGRRLEENIVHEAAVMPLCTDVSVYIEGYEKYDGKLNETAIQAEQHKDYWLLLVDYTPGSQIYAWSLFPENMRLEPSSPTGHLNLGEGTISQITTQICTAVARRSTDSH